MVLDNLTGGVFPCSYLVDSSFRIDVIILILYWSGNIFDLVKCLYGIVFIALRAVFSSMLAPCV